MTKQYKHTLQVKFQGEGQQAYPFLSKHKIKIGSMVIVEDERNETKYGIVTDRKEGVEDANTKKVIRKVRRNEILYHSLAHKAYNLKLELSEDAYEAYRTTVKGNMNTTYEQAVKKLSRDIILSNKSTHKHRRLGHYVKYGRLYIYFDEKFSTITHVKNYMETPNKWVKDIELYNKLNEKFGIIAD